MSDSGDTDELLLIPHDYFICSAEAQLQQRVERLPATQPSRMDNADVIAASAVYRFLPPMKKAELNAINAQMQRLQHDDDEGHVSLPSDISTISNNTIRQRSSDCKLVVHSTPKCGSPQPKAAALPTQSTRDNGILLEIDDYLDTHSRYWRSGSNEDLRSSAHASALASASTLYTGGRGSQGERDVAYNSMPNSFQPPTFKQPTSASLAPPLTEVMNNNNNSNLISLSELWGKSDHLATTAIGPLQAASAAENSAIAAHTTLREEQLRRQHLEKTVHSLQSQLLECQQRLSVAIEVDRSKDTALAMADVHSAKLQAEVRVMQEHLQRSNAAQLESAERLDKLQREVADAVSAASGVEDKNKRLEADVAELSRCNSEYAEKMEALELKLLTSRRSEDYANNELSKLKDKLAKVEFHNEKLRARCDEFEQECATLRQQKDSLLDMQQKAKQRADALEAQRKSLQETLTRSEQTEALLQRKIELQQKSLKAHYQQQLENVVAAKLREFQAQLDRTEETLHAEARDRERLLAERAVKQLEAINEKSDLELHLLQQRHKEEVELYRIQLASASKKIDALDNKLLCYKTKRAEMAERLHYVMEAQWQKTLEILTSPNNGEAAAVKRAHSKIPNDGCNITIDANADDTLNHNEAHYDEHDSGQQNSNECADDHTTPKACKQQQQNSHVKENNLNAQKRQQHNHAHNCADDGMEAMLRPQQPMDRLQAYIELLLSKSPSDFDKLDEILALSSKRSKWSGANKWEKCLAKRNQNQMSNNKPPWKA